MKKDLREKVLHCLKEFSDTRNSDITLTIKIWEVFHEGKIKTGKTGEKGIWLKDLYDLPREDNVKRHRALIQNGHKRKGVHIAPAYLPTSLVVAKQRKINEQRWLDYVRLVSDSMPEYEKNT